MKQSAEEMVKGCARLLERKLSVDVSAPLQDELEKQKTAAEKQNTDHDLAISALRERLNDPRYQSSRFDARLGLLTALEHLQRIEGLTICPVCDQPFLDLNSHISEKIASLRTEQTSVQEEVRGIERELEVRVSEKSSNLRVIEGLRSRLEGRATEVLQFESELASFVERFKNLVNVSNSLEQIAQIATEQEDLAATEIEELKALLDAFTEVRTSISASQLGSVDLRKQLRDAEEQNIVTTRRLEEAQSAHRRLDLFIETTQEVRRRLSSGIDEIIRGFVLGRAKDTFQELFRRLAKNPFFDVTVSDVRMKRHKAEVDWCAKYGDDSFPGEAVFSQGELNACAIAFFLALATSHSGGLELLLLDDPVQNMDEIHIEEFGNVLKFLKDVLGWQIVIGLHDLSVYQFLKRQLHPSREGHSLIGYTFEEGDLGTHITRDTLALFDPSALIANVA
jgi:DNA repair protein SbcC/Rad50